MRYENILVVAKRSRYEHLCRRNGRARIDRMIRRGDPAVRNILQGHRDHQRFLQGVVQVLSACGLRYRLTKAFERRPRGRFDLVISVGGDGTFLWASHGVRSEHMLGINSTPKLSKGVFCAAQASDFKDVLAAALEGRMPVVRLTRIEATLDDQKLGALATNDALFAHRIPAATTRYILLVGQVEEEQKSSGIWISTAAGSTAALHSAGGRVMPIGSRRLQYLVREPYQQGLVNLGGFLPPGEAVHIRSKMNHGRIFIDGMHRAFRVPFGAVVTVKASESPLLVLGIERRGG